MVLANDGYHLSPAFDVLPAMRNLRYRALRVGRAQMDSTLDDAMSECAAFGVSTDEAAALIGGVCQTVAGWREVFVGEGVGARDIAALEPFLDGDKAAMRRDFRAAGGRRRL